MNRLLLEKKNIGPAFALRMRMIYQILYGNFPLENVVNPVISIFYLLSGSMEKRDFLPEGYMKFSIGFHKYNDQYFYSDTSEKLQAFYDEFFDFMDDCFPQQLNEEVLY